MPMPPCWLEEHRIPASARSHRLRLDHERNIDAPAWLFSAEGLEFDVTVLPQDSLRQAPLSGVDGKPMRRISLNQLRLLLAEPGITGNIADLKCSLPRKQPTQTNAPHCGGA